MVQNSMKNVIQRYATETIGETDFQKSRDLRAKYAELIPLQSKFPDDIVVITMTDFKEGVENGQYKLGSPCMYHIIEGTEEEPILGTIITTENLEELSTIHNYVGFSKLLA